MRVAYLINTYPRPSHSFIRREIQAHERAGVKVLRFAFRDERQALVDPADIAEWERTEYVLGVGMPRLLLAALVQALTGPRRLARALRIALACGNRSPRGMLHHLVYLVEALFLARRFRALGVTHFHVHFGTNAATVALLVRALGGPSWSFTVHGPEEFDSPVALSLPEKIASAALTIAVSAFGRSQLCRWSDHAKWDRLEVVHCGIDPREFAAPSFVSPRGPSGETRLVAVGRLVEQKGQLLLIDAFARAIAQQPGLRLRLVGDGELRSAIERVIEAKGLRGQVTIVGWLDEAGVQRELADAHALVMPSFAEGLPMVIMEAMAKGRPVAATMVAGIPELVQHGQTGWLIPAGDVEGLATVLQEIAVMAPEDLEMLGRQGRMRALERHDVDREAAKLRALFWQASSSGEMLEAPAPTVSAEHRGILARPGA